MYSHSIRVGNIVKDVEDDFNEWHVVHALHYEYLDYPTQQKGYVIQLKPCNKNNITHALPETIIPVMLTKEWLKQLGFKKQECSGGYWYELAIDEDVKIVTNDSICNDGLGEWYLGIQYFDCDTYFDESWNAVHHAQNLFFAHTNKNLPV